MECCRELASFQCSTTAVFASKVFYLKSTERNLHPLYHIILIELSLISKVDLLPSHLAQLVKFHLHSKEVSSRHLSWNQLVHACELEIRFCYFGVVRIESVTQLIAFLLGHMYRMVEKQNKKHLVIEGRKRNWYTIAALTLCTRTCFKQVGEKMHDIAITCSNRRKKHLVWWQNNWMEEEERIALLIVWKQVGEKIICTTHFD